MGQKPEIITVVDEIGRYGAAVFLVTSEEYYAEGFRPGDIVTVTINGKKFIVPQGTAYSDVDSHELILLKIALEDRMILAVNNEPGFAEKNGIRRGDEVRIKRKKKGGYLKEYRLRSVLMSGDRADYESDEAFANFRTVKAGNILPGRLYRGFSPINPSDNRNLIADRLLSQTGVRTAINLDNEDLAARSRYPGYAESFYAGLRVVPVRMSFSPEEESFPESIRAAVTAAAENPAPLYIHCRYSRDRTGLLCAILEALCGASPEEIRLDYMLSYENIHHLRRDSEKWEFQAVQHVDRVLSDLLGIGDFGRATGEMLCEKTKEMLTLRCGLPDDTIQKLVENLCRKD